MFRNNFLRSYKSFVVLIFTNRNCLVWYLLYDSIIGICWPPLSVADRMREGFHRVELNKTIWEVSKRYDNLTPVGSGAYGQVRPVKEKHYQKLQFL